MPLTFRTIFFGFILVPIPALSIELGRYFYAQAEIATAAGAAGNQVRQTQEQARFPVNTTL